MRKLIVEAIATVALIAAVATVVLITAVGGSTSYAMLGQSQVDPLGAMRLNHLAAHQMRSVPLWIPG
jgi:hypothetical protein